MAEPRQATGTPIRELFETADRMAAMERKIEALIAMDNHLLQLLGIAAQTQMMQHQRIHRLESVAQNDIRLSDVLRGVEERLGRIELGGEMP